jgi:hypothetical protein
MRDVLPTLSLVPDFDTTVHLVLDHFGTNGRAYREVDQEEADLEAVIDALVRGQYKKPVRVVAFITSEGWARDASEDVGWEILRRIAKEGKPVPASTRDFLIFHVGEDETLRAENGVI